MTIQQVLTTKTAIRAKTIEEARVIVNETLKGVFPDPENAIDWWGQHRDKTVYIAYPEYIVSSTEMALEDGYTIISDITADVSGEVSGDMAEIYGNCCYEVAKKHKLGNTLVTGHKASYFIEAAVMAMQKAITPAPKVEVDCKGLGETICDALNDKGQVDRWDALYEDIYLNIEQTAASYLKSNLRPGDKLDGVDNGTCQCEVEGEGRCIVRCDHCISYYKEMDEYQTAPALQELGEAGWDFGKVEAFMRWKYDNRWFNFEDGLWCYTFEHGTAMSRSTYRKNYMKTTAQLVELWRKSLAKTTTK